MPTFQLTGPDGGTYRLDAPDEQSALSAFGALHADAPDKYQQAAQADIAAVKAAGGDEGAGLTRRLVHGATLGADSTLMAAALTPLEMIKRGTLNPAEAYAYNKAREDLIMNDARQNTGALGTAAEMLGGAVAGGGLANGGITAARFLPSAPGLLGRTAASAADAGVLGGVAGFNEGNGLSDRLSNAGQGALFGGAVGGALPVAGAVAKGIASPFISNIIARVDPNGYAQRQVARAIHESGDTPDAIATALQQAQAEGQGNYTLADALGNSGQRMLSGVARAPGEGRTNVVNYLENRQAGQARRVANTLSEGFQAPETAAQTEARLTNARDTTADTEFGAVRNDAQPVDLSNVIARIDETLTPGVNQIATGSNIANDTTEAALQGFRNRLTDGRSNLTDFTAVQRVRGDLSDAVQAARRAGAGNRARLLGGVLRELDASMENASQGFRQANANFAQASRNIDAVQAGRDAFQRGRVEDTIPQYEALTPEGQAAFRSGYIDPAIANTQGAALGVNKARPFANEAFQQEAGAMAPGNALMQNRLGREMRMFETRNAALGGSKTADNLADADALGVDPSIVGHVLSGNYAAAARHLISAGSNAVTGNTPAVRSAVADILLRNGTNLTGPQLDQMVGQTIRRIQFVQELAQGARSAAGGAIAIAPQIFKRRASR